MISCEQVCISLTDIKACDRSTRQSRTYERSSLRKKRTLDSVTKMVVLKGRTPANSGFYSIGFGASKLCSGNGQ